MKQLVAVLLGICFLVGTEQFFLTFRDYRQFFKFFPKALDEYKKATDLKPYRVIPVHLQHPTDHYHDHESDHYHKYGSEKHKHHNNHEINDEFQSNYNKHTGQEYKPYGSVQHNKYFKNDGHKCVHHHHHHGGSQNTNTEYDNDDDYYYHRQSEPEYFDNRRNLKQQSTHRDQTATNAHKSEVDPFIPPEHRKNNKKAVKDYVSGILVVVPKGSYKKQHRGENGDSYYGDLEKEHSQYYGGPTQDESEKYNKFVKEYLSNSFPSQHVEDEPISA